MTTPRRPDLLIEGRIATFAGTAGWGWVEALAIAGGRVVATGTAADVIPLAGPRTKRWRLSPEAVGLPGITDAHLHLLTVAAAEREIDLEGAPTLVDMLERLRTAHLGLAATGDQRGWLLGSGWSLDRIGRWPDAALLDRVAPGRPVALYAHDRHSRWLSTRAMESAGIGASTPDPQGGSLGRDEHGQPTGILHERACPLVDDVVPEPSVAELEASLERVERRLVALGVTGCHDPGLLVRSSNLERGPLLYRRLAEHGRLGIRVHSSVRETQLEAAIEAGLRSGAGQGRFRMGWLKLFADGSLGSRSAALLAPYSDASERPPTGSPTGMLTTPAQELRRLVGRAAAAGIAGQVHAIGDAAVRTTLGVLAGLPALTVTHRIEHAQLVDPVDVRSFGRADIAASVQPVHLRTDATAARQAWGERAEHAFPLRSLVRTGALIPFGTDAPVEPFDPWPGIATAVARRDPLQADEKQLGATEALTLERALRAACVDPALVAGQRDVGRLVAGSVADLIVVSDLHDHQPPEEIAAVRPVATLIDGRLVHQSEGFDPAL